MVEDSGGAEVVDREVELMAFSRIVGVSCNGHTDRLKEAFALILADKTYKPNKHSAKGGRAGKKGTRELVNLFSLVNYEGGSGSVLCNRGKGRGNGITL